NELTERRVLMITSDASTSRILALNPNDLKVRVRREGARPSGDLARALVLATALALAGFGSGMAQGNNAQGKTGDAIAWGPAPPVLPKGGQMAVLSGDPGKAGHFTVRLRMPAGYKIPAHQHPHSEPVTVISGELMFGMGDKLDEKSAKKLGPGGFVDLPANLILGTFDVDRQRLPPFTEVPQPAAPESKIRDVVDALRTAKAPLVVIGKGAAYARAERQINALINR
ncbi:MAG: hypothetical protein M1823_006620, partial [Watsoniomyces obsoletus]